MMRAAVIVCLALLPARVSAQTYSDDEQSLIEAMEECWNQATHDNSMEVLRDACGSTEVTTYWWTPETTPFRHLSPWVEGIRASWDRELISQDLRPIRVHLDGEFGFIYFHGIRIWESQEGGQETESWRGFEVWKRVNGGWSFVGGTGTPDSLNQIR